MQTKKSRQMDTVFDSLGFVKNLNRVSCTKVKDDINIVPLLLFIVDI